MKRPQKKNSIKVYDFRIMGTRIKYTCLGGVLSRDLVRARSRYNQRFETGQYAVYDGTRPVRIINARTPHTLVVQLLDRLDTPIVAVPARLIWTGTTYRAVSPTTTGEQSPSTTQKKPDPFTVGWW